MTFELEEIQRRPLKIIERTSFSTILLMIRNTRLLPITKQFEDNKAIFQQLCIPTCLKLISNQTGGQSANGKALTLFWTGGGGANLPLAGFF